MGQKRSDLDTLPLCHVHHEEQHRIGWPSFIQTYELDVHAILAELREKPRLFITQRIVSLARFPTSRAAPEPHYIALYKGQEFTLKPVSFGINISVMCATRVCGEYLRDQLLQRAA